VAAALLPPRRGSDLFPENLGAGFRAGVRYRNDMGGACARSREETEGGLLGIVLPICVIRSTIAGSLDGDGGGDTDSAPAEDRLRLAIAGVVGDGMACLT